MPTSRKVWLFFAWSAVLTVAVFLRFGDVRNVSLRPGDVRISFNGLADRPFHFDEATGARITSQRMHTRQGYRFDPEHNHGPLLSAVAAPVCRLNGEDSWQKMSKSSLRFAPAVAGTLLVLVPLLWRRRFGDAPALAAAALLATSPLLVYYSRMFIHEMLLTFLGLATVAVACTSPRVPLVAKAVVLGALVGLMFATKETFAISIIAWTAAGAVLALTNIRNIRRHNTAKNRHRLLREYRAPAAGFFLAAAASAGWLYTNGLSHPGGAWDAVKTFFVYRTTAGHDKAFSYYLEMLAVPAGNAVRWHELPVLLLAAASLARSYLPGTKGGKTETITRFLALSAIFHLLVYSLISYKTPWLMCLPWAHVCLLGGLALRGTSGWKPVVKTAAALLLAGVLLQQLRLAVLASGRFASDRRNPYAYTPTSGDTEALQRWMRELADQSPPGGIEPIAVVGREYWPLPWYLRDFDRIGYWPLPVDGLSRFPVVFAMPEHADAVGRQLGSTHTAQPRSLRANVPVMIYLRNDIWHRWMHSDE